MNELANQAAAPARIATRATPIGPRRWSQVCLAATGAGAGSGELATGSGTGVSPWAKLERFGRRPARRAFTSALAAGGVLREGGTGAVCRAGGRPLPDAGTTGFADGTG